MRGRFFSAATITPSLLCMSPYGYQQSICWPLGEVCTTTDSGSHDQKVGFDQDFFSSTPDTRRERGLALKGSFDPTRKSLRTTALHTIYSLQTMPWISAKLESVIQCSYGQDSSAWRCRLSAKDERRAGLIFQSSGSEMVQTSRSCRAILSVSSTALSD